MKLIWQLLRQHVSVLQLAGFLVTNLVGVAIVLTAVQLYRDVTPALQAPDSFLDNDFIILTKEVEGAGIGKTSFTQAELAELAEQPFTEALGEFTPARYSVKEVFPMPAPSTSLVRMMKSLSRNESGAWSAGVTSR